MSADLTLVRVERRPFDWRDLGWLDQDAQIAYLEAQRRQDFVEIQQLRRQLRAERPIEPGAALGAWIIGSVFVLAIFVAGVCMAPLLDALLVDFLRALS